MRLATISFLAILSTAGVARAQAEPPPPVSARGPLGISGTLGTDIILGIGAGVGVSYVIAVGSGRNSVELAGQLFLAHSSESSTEGIHDYDETTDIALLAARGNFLFGYQPDRSATYFIVGGGLTAVSMSWTESSPTDTSLGPPRPEGGSQVEEDGTATGSVLTGGVGRTFGGGLDVRLELPLLVFFNEVGEAAAIVPTLTVSAGYRF